MQTVIGKISRIIFEENGFVILRILAKGNIYSEDGENFSWQTSSRESELCVKGTMLHPVFSVEYTFSGNWTVQKGYGPQLDFVEYSRQHPISEKAITDYLALNCKGIGIQTARKIYTVFGSESIEILKTEPLRVASQVNISADKAIEASKRLEDIEDSEALKLQLSSLLSGTLANRGHINAIIKKYQSSGPDIVLRQPYTLTEVSGIGFKIADSIAVKNGIDLESPERICACGEYIIKNWERGGGHTCILRSILIQYIVNETNLDKDIVSNHLNSHIEIGKFVAVSDYVYRRRMYDMEKDVARMLVDLAMAKVEAVEPKIDGLEEDQAEAVRIASCNPVMIMTGSAGTGKTHTIKKMCETFSGYGLALIAQTGKAARRMTEATGRKATTIHSLLCPVATKGDDDNVTFSFMHGKNCKLELDVIIVDETSLLDIELAYSLISSIRNGTRLIIVGDPFQLPSVGPGRFLVDSIKSECMPHVELKKIKRQGEGSAIIKACHEIKTHQVPDIVNKDGTDLYLWPSNGDDSTVATTIDLFTKKIASKFGYSIDDIQIITPNKNPDLPISTFRINNEIQKIVNTGYSIEASSRTIDKTNKIEFRIGDRVINTKNCQAYEYLKDENILLNEIPIVNGDIGKITGLFWRGAFYSQEDIEQLNDGSRNELLTARPKELSMIVELQQATVGIPVKKNFLDLSYAVTCHKYQGSECPVAIIPLPQGSNNLLNKNWIYTALSRGKSLVIIVSPTNAFNFCCLTPEKSRDSYLSYFIKNEADKLTKIKESTNELGWSPVGEEDLAF